MLSAKSSRDPQRSSRSGRRLPRETAAADFLPTRFRSFSSEHQASTGSRTRDSLSTSRTRSVNHNSDYPRLLIPVSHNGHRDFLLFSIVPRLESQHFAKPAFFHKTFSFQAFVTVHGSGIGSFFPRQTERLHILMLLFYFHFERLSGRQHDRHF